MFCLCLAVTAAWPLCKLKTEYLPVVALVGRPNVGKSTLFNRLTRTRDALVADYPGLTRDRRYGRCSAGSGDFLIVDTGGIPAFILRRGKAGGGLEQAVLRQVKTALWEADLILFLVDGRAGLTAADEEIADQVRSLNKPVMLVINKIDSEDSHLAAAEFSGLGFGEMVGISAAHGRGIAHLLEQIETRLTAFETQLKTENSKLRRHEEESIRVAVVGRPNVGKSTLVNRLLREERVVVADLPGTTRDPIAVPFERDGRRYTLIDTAGIRRRSKALEAVEKFSVIKAMQTIETAQVVIFLIDAREGVTDQDARLISYVLEAGKALVVGLNKWDGLNPEHKLKLKAQIETKLRFIDFVERIPISALHGSGVGDLFDRVPVLYEQVRAEFSTARLCRVLKQAVERNPPPLVKGRRIKLKFAHQGGKNPPLIVIHGNQTQDVPASYRRFLIHYFLQALGLKGTPIRVEFRTSENPFAGREGN